MHSEAHTTTTTSVDDEAEAQELRVYPNPVRDVLECTVPIETTRITLYDAHGARVDQRMNVNGTVRFPTEGIPNGIYIVVVEGKWRILTKNVVVAR